MPASPHLWLALSPHGYGHATMTAPVIAALRRRRPDLRLTIQTTVAHDFLVSRYGLDFTQVAEINDFGFVMTSSTEVDVAASARAYAALHADFDEAVERERALLEAARPNLVLANVPYVICEAAGRVGIPVYSLSSLNWADIFDHYLGDMAGAEAIRGQMRAAYGRAEAFLLSTPGQDTTLPNVRRIGVLAHGGQDRRAEMAGALGVEQGTRIGLIAFGGISHSLPMERWPVMPGWVWLHGHGDIPGRPDLRSWQESGLGFSDLLASADVVVTKPGYGTFTEAALDGTPVLYVHRPEWPESQCLEEWLAQHGQGLATDQDSLFGGRLPALLQTLFALPKPEKPKACGFEDAAAILDAALARTKADCERS